MVGLFILFYISMILKIVSVTVNVTVNVHVVYSIFLILCQSEI